MARKFSAFTNSPTRAATDTLVGLDVSAAAAAQNSYWTLNTLFSEISLNTTDGSIRWGGVVAPAVSAAGKGAIYFDSTSNTFKVSQNTGAYFNVGNITTTGFTATRIPIANAANTLIDDAGLTFNTSTNILTVGETTGGGVGLLGSNGNSNVLASQAPAATLLTYWPNAAPTAGQFLYAATVGAQVQLGYQTAPSGSGSANQIAVWGASNALSGSSALTFASGVVSITGTTNPGVVITGSAATESGITVNQSVSGAAADAFHSFQTPSTTVVWRLTTAGFTPTGLIKANQLDTLGASGTVEMLFRLADASTRFVYGVNNVEAASINATSTLGLVLGVDSTLTGRVRMFNSAGTTYTQLSAGNAAASLNYILPATSPSAGYVLSASAPSGSDVTLSWAAAASAASLTATQVGFGDGTNMLSGSADFTYATATGVLDITKSVNSSLRMTVTNGNTGNAAQARFGATADAAFTGIIAYGSGFTTSGLRVANSSVVDMDGTAGSIFIGNASGSFRWGLGTTEYARMTSTVYTLYGPTTGSVTGLSVTSAAAGSGTSMAVVSSGTNEALTITSKGSGPLQLAVGGTTQIYADASGPSIGSRLRFGTAAASPSASLAWLSSSTIRVSDLSTGAGSLLIGTSSNSIGTSGVGVLAIANGTAPTTSPADEFQLYSADAAVGDAQAFARNEAGAIARLTGTIAYVTSQFDVANSTALATVTGSTVNVEAGLRYRFIANVFCDAGASGGIKPSIGGTATATSVIFQTMAVENTTTAFAFNTRQTALDGATTVVGGTGYWVQIQGTIVVNAGGTLGIRFAQAVSDGTNSSVLVGSSFQIWQS